MNPKKGEYLFEVKGVWKTYRMKGVKTHALRGVDLNIKAGEYVALFGPSGSGKSTLMHIMGCLDSPTKGEVIFNNRTISKLSSDSLAIIRREKMGFVFQSYNLVNGLTAIENVALPMRFKGVSKIKSLANAKAVLEQVDLGDRLNHKPTELSGGQQQRVGIARALANNPDVLLMDEPTGNLDTKTGDEITKLIETLHKEQKKTVLVVTHDRDLAKKADRQVLIKDGKIHSDNGKKHVKKYAGA